MGIHEQTWTTRTGALLAALLLCVCFGWSLGDVAIGQTTRPTEKKVESGKEPATRPVANKADAAIAVEVTERVIFVVDASGSMTHMGMFDWVKEDLAKTIDALPATAQFNLIFFVDKKYPKTLSPKLLQADAGGKEKANRFLGKMETLGDTNPIPALKFAFKQKPQVIHLFTDGVFENPSNEEVIDTIQKLNPEKAVKVNTVFVTPEEIDARDEQKGGLNESIIQTLKKIAADNSGEFRTAVTR